MAFEDFVQEPPRRGTALAETAAVAGDRSLQPEPVAR